MSQPSLRPQKTALLLAQRIVGDIHQRGNRAGDRLPPERVMLEEYSVGRGTLRESLRFLELQGVISLRPGPGGGPVVQQPRASNLAHSLTLLLQFEHASFRTVVEARGTLEPVMAQLAAQRMSDEQIVELGRSVETREEQPGDEGAVRQQDRQFHGAIAHGSGNAALGCLVDALLETLHGSATGVDLPDTHRSAVDDAHRAIYASIAARDPARSAAAMRDHLAAHLEHAERTFPDVLDAPVTWFLGTT
ncbi:FadR family transcriptional regulator [Nocardioides sp. ChNu-153]|uniref:FadR/GntR family transcriptional regulator n=1 Tax=unclassified Nocardioides TaxID=2615069 RepID=UPI0024070B33|nr:MULTISPECIES: FCD domain-containing protein [unclassified Nocardioides]MDF9715335.1 FCD domain-containing protein [Nocardioides sp. ChNu-99]MDN7121740.1 FadR family transcriptional regulator [Nocardioides sp. ChNu-153]